ncbi:hypothetical protein HY639_00220 [Candidatus Woesearchaeota archaeon]|nr:hypothetical protein [Candidatus Woesearchaeota archaeon]
MRKSIILFLALLALPVVLATHTDIPYYAYDVQARSVYDHGTDTGYQSYYVPSSTTYRPYYDAGYRQGTLYERYGYTTDYERRGSEYDSRYGYSGSNDRYRESESYQKTMEYNYDRYGRSYSSYDPRYDGRRSRTFTQDYYDGMYRPSLYGSGRIAIEDRYGPVYYNYRGQRYGYDEQGRRFYY